MIKVSGNTYRTGWPYLLALLLLLPSCRQEDETAFAVGDSGFFLSLVEVAGENLTRTAPSELGVPEPEQFHLLVLKDDGRQIYDGNYASEIPAPLGSYTLTASYGENVSLGLDAPYYEGTATAELTETAPHAEVPIKCRVANALLSVKYVVADAVADGEEQTYTESDARFRKFFSDFGVKVSIGNQSVMLKNATASSAYFPAGSTIALQFYGTMLDPADKTVTYDIPDTQNLFSDIAAGKHLILSLSYASIETGVVLTVEKVEVKQETISATIPLEWLPAPKLTGFADGSNVVTYTETADAVSAAIGYTTSAPLQDVEFTLDFLDENLNALNGTYLLSELTSDQRVAFAEAGIDIPIIGTKTGNFDFTDMTPTLLSNKGADVVNTIKLRVKANNRWSSEEGDVYTIKTVAPTLAIAVQDGNVWSKEFTIDPCVITGGKVETILADLKYQYRLNGTTSWIDCTDENVQYFSGHPTERVYDVRAVYRDVISSNVVTGVTLEEPKQVPNGDMNAWTETTKTARVSSFESYSRPFYQPWNTTVGAWWDTNNNVTVKTSISSCLLDKTNLPNYKSFPTVVYENRGNGDYAAVIRSVAVANGNSEIVGSGSTTGILYVGSTDDSGNQTEGRDFTTRPTALSFECKYDSYDNERFGIYVELYNGTTSIASGSLLSTNGTSISNFTTYTIKLAYTNELLKATSIRISFYSVAQGDSPATRKVTISIPAGSYKIYGGSVLTVDNINLIYDR